MSHEAPISELKPVEDFFRRLTSTSTGPLPEIGVGLYLIPDRDDMAISIMVLPDNYFQIIEHLRLVPRMPGEQTHDVVHIEAVAPERLYIYPNEDIDDLQEGQIRRKVLAEVEKHISIELDPITNRPKGSIRIVNPIPRP